MNRNDAILYSVFSMYNGELDAYISDYRIDFNDPADAFFSECGHGAKQRYAGFVNELLLYHCGCEQCQTCQTRSLSVVPVDIFSSMRVMR